MNEQRHSCVEQKIVSRSDQHLRLMGTDATCSVANLVEVARLNDRCQDLLLFPGAV